MVTAYHLRSSISTVDLGENRGLAVPILDSHFESAEHYNRMLDTWLEVLVGSLARVKV